MNFGAMFGVVLPAVAVVTVFTFVAIAVWSDNRRKEREAYYREETYKKLLDSTSEKSEAVLAVMKRQEDQKERRRIEGLKLGGLITTAVGVGVMVFFWVLAPGEGAYGVGIIPLLIGLALAIYAYVLAPKP